MERIRVASRRIKRVCPMWALSIGRQLLFRVATKHGVIPKRTREAAVTAAGKLYPHSCMIRNTTGTVKEPNIAGIARNAT